MNRTIRITGHEEIVRKLRSLDRKVASAIVRKVLRHCSKTIAAEARSLAPRRTGFMASQIKVRSAKRKRGRIGVNVQVGVNGDFDGKAFYGGMTEFGYRIGPRHLGDRRRMKPGRSFMGKAFKRKGPKLQTELPRMFWDQITIEVNR